MEIRDALNSLNEWWISGKVSSELAKPYKRKVFAEALRILKEHRQILVLTGMRRVGKSTLIYQLIGDLLESVEQMRILYFTFDAGATDLLKLMTEYKSITGIDWKHEHIYLFLDEVQKLHGWSSQVKLIYDTFPNIKIVVSGSASLQLESGAASDLTGRHFAIEMKPLSIIEYYELRYKKKIDRTELYTDELLAELERYLLRVFPETVGWQNENDVKVYIRENVVSKIVRGDLPDTFKTVNFRLLEGMLRLFFDMPGMILSTDVMSKEFGISKTTLENHIFYLEFSKLIRVVRNFRPNVRMESRKLKKIYPSNISLALASGSVMAPQVGETVVASAIDATNYWRMGVKEVDFILKDNLLPIEVKHGRGVDDNELKSIRYFMKKYKTGHGVVVYSGEKKERRGNIMIVPLISLLTSGLPGAYKKPVD